jgi:PleD family two-component response regulator
VRAAFEAEGAMIVGHRMGATVSVGAADCLAKGCNIGRLLSRSDAALYASKQSGRNRVTCAPDDVAPAPHAERRTGGTAQVAGLLHAA